MRNLISCCLGLALLIGFAPATVEAKKKKSGLKIRFEVVVDLPESLRPTTEMTDLSEADLTEAGYTRTGTVFMDTVTRRCTYLADGSEKCKTPKKRPNGHDAVLAEVTKQGGGLVVMGTSPDESTRDVMGKVCISWRPDRGGLAECSDWRESRTGYEVVRSVECTVWNKLP